MNLDLVVTLIMLLCENDSKTYILNDNRVGCYIYYTNCVIDENGSEESRIDACRNKAEAE